LIGLAAFFNRLLTLGKSHHFASKELGLSYIRINKHYVHLPYLYLGLVEALVLLAASYFAQGFSQEGPVSWPGAAVFAAVLSCSTLAMGVYGALLRESGVSLFLRVLVSFCLLGSAALFVLDLFLPAPWLSSSNVFWSVLIAGAMIIPTRMIFRKLVDLSQLRRRVVLFGAGQKAQKLLDELAPEMSTLGIEIIGCIANANETVLVDKNLVIPEPSHWLDEIKRAHISEIVICPDERRRGNGSEFPLEALLDCKLAGVPSSDALSFCERELGKIDLGSLQPSWMLFSDGFKYSKRSLAAKRLFDLVLASLFFILLWPFMLLTALAVKLESPGPVLYHQLRVGLNGRHFRIYKFRSMRQDAEKSGAQWATKNDARITRVGAFIRNTRLDELPQLYNVLSGSMSFVGPRPERPEFVTDLSQQIPYYDLRHKVKPGLMGWAQLKYPYGASVEDARNKLQYDLYYTKNHSFFIDILIMIQTVEIILLGKGVH
jgi:sugar transferase (PEP-CTERM system associated)